MSEPMQKWIHDADVGCYRRLMNGNYELLPHDVAVVLASDAEAAIAAAEQRGREDAIARLGEWQKHSPLGGKTYEQGQRDALAAAEQECGERSHGHYMDGQRDMLARCIAAVEALPGTGTHTPGLGSVLGRKQVLSALRALGGSDD